MEPAVFHDTCHLWRHGFSNWKRLIAPRCVQCVVDSGSNFSVDSWVDCSIQTANISDDLASDFRDILEVREDDNSGVWADQYGRVRVLCRLDEISTNDDQIRHRKHSTAHGWQHARNRLFSTSSTRTGKRKDVVGYCTSIINYSNILTKWILIKLTVWAKLKVMNYKDKYTHLCFNFI